MGGRVTGALGVLVLLLLTRPAGAANVPIVQSSRIAGFDAAVRAFEQVFCFGIARVGPKPAQGHRLSTLVLADHGADTALGEKAAELAAKLLTGSSASGPPPPARADRFRVRVNQATPAKLGPAMSEAPSEEAGR